MRSHLAAPVADRGRATPRARAFLWVFSGLLVMTAGTAFVFKLIEFVHVATSPGADALASFLIPVLNYLVVAAGFGFLFLWAYSRGEFRDVERTKLRVNPFTGEELQKVVGSVSDLPPDLLDKIKAAYSAKPN